MVVSCELSLWYILGLIIVKIFMRNLVVFGRN